MHYGSSQTRNGNTNLFFLPPHYLSLSFCVLLQLSLASVSIWFTYWLSFSKACCCSIQHCYSSFLYPSISILVCDSSFPSPPFILSVTLHLSPLLSFVLSSLHRYPNVFIFSTLLTFIQFVFFSIAVSIFSFPIAPTPIAPFLLSVLLFSLLSHSNAPLSYLPSMVFSYC